MLTVALLLLALLAVPVSSVSVSFKSCGASSDEGKILSIVANEFPPVPGDTLVLNVTANLSKAVTSGEYKVGIVWDTVPLPGQNGSISDFYPLPWPVGILNISYSTPIPDEVPKGNYELTISAIDQDKHQIFCFKIQFTISAEQGGVAVSSSKVHQSQRPLGVSRLAGGPHNLRLPIRKLVSGRS